MKNPVAWFEIYVDDLPRATRFYETVLGISLQKMESPVPHLQMNGFPSNFEAYGITGALVKMEGFTPKGAGTIVYFHCEDCAIEESRVAAAGGLVEKSKMPIATFGFISLVVDTEGNLIGLHSRSQ